MEAAAWRQFVVINVRRSWVFLLTVLVFACHKNHGGSSDAGGPLSSESHNDEAAPEAAPPASRVPDRARRPPRHGGLVGLILRAAHQTATAEQKAAVLGIQESLQNEEPPLTSLKDYQADLAAGIRAGKLDMTKLRADYAPIDKGLLAQEDKQAEALNALHAALDAPARHALVASARAHLGPMFHSRSELLDAGGADGRDAGGDNSWVNNRVARATTELGLEEAQKPKLAAVLARASTPPQVIEARRETIRKHAEAVLLAFDQDDFDAKKLDLSATGLHAAPHGPLEHEAVLLGQVLVLLTPEQREKLAAQKSRHVGRWLEDPEPWSPFEEQVDPHLMR
jgi:hypothetical protein